MKSVTLIALALAVAVAYGQPLNRRKASAEVQAVRNVNRNQQTYFDDYEDFAGKGAGFEENFDENPAEEGAASDEYFAEGRPGLDGDSDSDFAEKQAGFDEYSEPDPAGKSAGFDEYSDSDLAEKRSGLAVDVVPEKRGDDERLREKLKKLLKLDEPAPPKDIIERLYGHIKSTLINSYRSIKKDVKSMFSHVGIHLG